jgi:hypothetical protein
MLNPRSDCSFVKQRIILLLVGAMEKSLKITVDLEVFKHMSHQSEYRREANIFYCLKRGKQLKTSTTSHWCSL